MQFCSSILIVLYQNMKWQIKFNNKKKRMLKNLEMQMISWNVHVENEISFSGDATLLVLSSSSALVNQTITISCLFEIGQEAAAFYFPNSIVCIAQFCVMHCGKMSLDCPNNQTYRLNATVSPSWHKKDFFCGHAFGGQRSNRVTMDIASKSLFYGMAF